MPRESSREFNRISSDYDKGRRSESVEYWAQETRRLAELDEYSLVLDLGCGTAIYSHGLKAETRSEVCGLDPVPGMLAQAREKEVGIHFLNATGEWLPLRSGVFDCVFSSQVWHHIEDRQGTANECARVLSPGGHVVVRTIGHEQLREKVVFTFFPEIMENQLRVYPSKGDFKRFFREAGFRSVEFHLYSLKRYQSVEEFIEVAEKKLWSMFRPISQEGLRRGVEMLRRHKSEEGPDVRNDELITVVVGER